MNSFLKIIYNVWFQRKTTGLAPRNVWMDAGDPEITVVWRAGGFATRGGPQGALPASPVVIPQRNAWCTKTRRRMEWKYVVLVIRSVQVDAMDG